MSLNWGQIFSSPGKTHQHMVATLKYPKLFAEKVYRAILRENYVLPVSKMTKAPFLVVVTSFKGLFQEESNLPIVHTSDGFDSDAYKLMEELGYNFSKLPSPGHVIDEKPCGPNDAQKMVQKHGDGIVTPSISRGYMPPQPVKISRWCEDKGHLCNTSWQKKLEMARVTTLHPAQTHRCSTCSHRHHNNILPFSAGWERTGLLSLLCFKDLKEVNNLNPPSSP